MSISYSRHQYPPSVILHAVWLYLRFTLKLVKNDEVQSSQIVGKPSLPASAAFTFYSIPLDLPVAGSAQLLSRMERDGIIRREPDPKDGRSSLIALTDDALAKLPAGRAILEAGNREAMRGLSTAEVATLINLLQRVLADTEEMESRAIQ